MDLTEHLASIWARRFVVLLVALGVAAAVFVFRLTGPAQYVASATVQIRVPTTTGTGDPTGEVEYYSNTTIGLATGRGVVREAIAATGRTDDTDDAVEQVSAEAGTQPGFVTISGFGDTPEEAVDLTAALVDAVVRQTDAQQSDDLVTQREAIVARLADVEQERSGIDPDDAAALEALESERSALKGRLTTLAEQVTPWRLAVVEAPQEPEAPDSPKPLRDGVLAFLIVLILGAEAVVVVRAWRGSLAERDPAADVASLLGVPTVAVEPDDGPGALSALMGAVAGARAVVSVHTGPDADAHGATLLAEILAQRGDSVLLLDASPDRPTVHTELGIALTPGVTDLPATAEATDKRLRALPAPHRLAVLPAGEGELPSGALARVVAAAPQDRVTVALAAPRLDDLVAALSEIDGPVVLDVDARTASRKRLAADAAALRGLDIKLVAATVQVGRRDERRRRDAREARGVWPWVAKSLAPAKAPRPSGPSQA